MPDLTKQSLNPRTLRTDKNQRGIFVSTYKNMNSIEYAAIEILPNIEYKNYRDVKPLNVIEIPYDPSNNLPTTDAQAACSKNTTEQETEILCAVIKVTEESNRNLSQAQKELLKWHFRLNHLGFQHLQWLVRQNRLKVPANLKNGMANCPIPKCAACLYAKARKTSTGVGIAKPKLEKEMELKKGDLNPGQRVSADHYQSAVPGRLYTSREGAHASDMYCGGCIFADHSSGYVKVEHQVLLSAVDTVKGKLRYERHLAELGVKVESYHTDNGTFTSGHFMECLLEQKQSIRFSGVGAAHQNGVAERNIKTIVDIARTILIHAAIHSEQGHITAELWPMAMDHAVWIYNRTPKMDSGMSPLELISRTKIWPYDDIFRNCHVWGSPAYILEPKLQKSGVKIPKWNKRSRIGIYLGFSKMHAHTVSLILNKLTRSITPQFHVVFDDYFTTISSRPDPDKFIAHWKRLLLLPNARLQSLVDEDETADDWGDERDTTINQPAQHITEEVRPTNNHPIDDGLTKNLVEKSSTYDQNPSSGLQEARNDRLGVADVKSSEAADGENAQDTSENNGENGDELVLPEEFENMSNNQFDVNLDDEAGDLSSSARRSTRVRRSPTYFNPGTGAARNWNSDQVINLAYVLTPHASKFSEEDEIEVFNLLADINYLDSAECPNPMLLGERYLAYMSEEKSNYDDDTPSYWQAVAGADQISWLQAMKSELDNLRKRCTWTVVQKAEIGKSLPAGQIVPVTWALKIKRHDDMSFRKYKGRFCVRGDLQRQHSDVESFAPVISWHTIRLMLTLSCFLGLHTTCVDFSNAFAQADIPEGQHVYIQVPHGFENEFPKDSCLKLNKSLYGQLDAARLWYEKLRDGLKARGLVPSKVDPCLFLSKKIIVICYVDDCLIFAKDQKDIDDLLESFKKDGDELNWEMTVGGTVEEFLGLNFEEIKVGEEIHYKSSQPGLIDKILIATGMTKCNGKKSPTVGKRALGPKLGSEPAEQKWKYASIIGMLLYLTNSMPEITFAVNQCARYTHGHRKAHKDAIL